MTLLIVDYVECHPIGGAEIYECAKEAALMALGEHREVRFTHNDRHYVAAPSALLSTVITAAISPNPEREE